MKPLRIPTLAAALLGVLTAACGAPPAEAPQAAQTRADLQPRAVTLVEPEVRERRPVLSVTGNVRADETVPVPAQVTGQVTRLLVEVGDTVAQGDPLAEIDRETYRLRKASAEAAVEAAAAELSLAERELKRKADLLSDHTIPQAVYDQARARRDLARARLAEARAAAALARTAWERSVVRAPAAGRVAERTVAPGQWVDAGQTVVRLASGDRIKVRVRVPEEWAGRLAGIRSFTFTVGSAGPFEARVFSVEPVVEAASRSFAVTGIASLPAGTPVRPGMFAVATLTAATPVRTVWIPESAVAVSEMATVMLVRHGRTVARRIVTGERKDGWVEVLRGLDPGERVVRDIGGLSDGTPVRVETR